MKMFEHLITSSSGIWAYELVSLQLKPVDLMKGFSNTVLRKTWREGKIVINELIIVFDH